MGQFLVVLLEMTTLRLLDHMANKSFHSPPRGLIFPPGGLESAIRSRAKTVSRLNKAISQGCHC